MSGHQVSVADLIKLYKLEEHPEGGYFTQTYRANAQILASTEKDKYKGPRYYSTGIYYLLPGGARSKLHKILSDEMWHFYLGGPMKIIELWPDGRVTETILGTDVLGGQVVQHVVPAGNWFGGFPLEGTNFSFVGCTVSPGFDFEDFEFGNKETLLKDYPKAKELISKLLD